MAGSATARASSGCGARSRVEAGRPLRSNDAPGHLRRPARRPLHARSARRLPGLGPALGRIRRHRPALPRLGDGGPREDRGHRHGRPVGVVPGLGRLDGPERGVDSSRGPDHRRSGQHRHACSGDLGGLERRGPGRPARPGRGGGGCTPRGGSTSWEPSPPGRTSRVGTRHSAVARTCSRGSWPSPCWQPGPGGDDTEVLDADRTAAIPSGRVPVRIARWAAVPADRGLPGWADVGAPDEPGRQDRARSGIAPGARCRIVLLRPRLAGIRPGPVRGENLRTGLRLRAHRHP